METDSIKGTAAGPQNLKARQGNGNIKDGFARVLSEQEENRSVVSRNQQVIPLEESSIQTESAKEDKRMFLGSITEKSPTLSHLLVGHPEYGKDCWRIIQSEQNRDKPYTKIKSGTAVFIDPNTFEITWSNNDRVLVATRFARKPKQLEPGSETDVGHGLHSLKKQSTRPRGESVSPGEVSADSNRTLLGTITKGTPTVSHLLVGHSEYGRDCWRIIHSEENRDKPYTNIQPGTDIFLNRETLEISWDRDGVGVQTNALAVQGGQEGNNEYRGTGQLNSFSTKLARAVEPYIGRSYEEMDCYELVVQGLVRLGIRYRGTGGLMERLEEMAAREGLPRNAYFNGEGLVEASGTKVYAKSFLRIRDSEAQAREVMKELSPLLEKGFIVSFSTHTKGHTGIVSRNDDDWTFINSGRMDHPLGMEADSRLVGEESLSEEIRDWLAVADELKESLKITVGRLDEKKLVTFHDPRFPGLEEA